MPANGAQKRGRRGAGPEVVVEERNDEPGVWTVEAIDMSGDGEIYRLSLPDQNPASERKSMRASSMIASTLPRRRLA